MDIILTAIAPLFTIIIVAALVKIIITANKSPWRRLVDKITHRDDIWSEVLNKFALYISLPALIFYTLVHTEPSTLLSWSSIWINVGLIIFIIIVTHILTKYFKLDKKLANVYILCGFFGNVAYIGLPFVLSLYPGSGGQLGVLIAIHVIIAFTIGLGILEYSKHKRANFKVTLLNIVKNPLVISIALGLLFLKFGWSVPEILDATVMILAGSASPVVLTAIGLFIARKIKIDAEFFHSTLITFLKIVIMPILFLLVAFYFKLGGSFHSSILEAAMPVAITNFAMAEIYPMNKKVVANAIMLSTIFSVFTLTFFSMLLAI